MNQYLSKEIGLLFNAPVQPSLKLSVIVPAKNESLDIVLTLDALRRQYDLIGNPVGHHIYEVLVLANNCTDDTFMICKDYQENHPTFKLHVECIEIDKEIAHIGTVRRILMDAAYRRLMGIAGGSGIIVSTDADSQVDKNWIHNILLEMDNGVDVVGGRILPRQTPELSRIHHLRDVTYRFFRSRLESELDPCPANPWPRHFQCYGPSLAVTCDIYERAGRLPAIPYLEDEEFRKALKRIDAKIRHSPNVRIHTSSRLDGRVKFGFSVQLRLWSDMSINSEQQMVETLDTLIFKLGLKNKLRKIWNRQKQLSAESLELLNTASLIKMNINVLIKIFQTSLYFETLWEQIEQQLEESENHSIISQPISLVIQAFRHYFSKTENVAVQRTEFVSTSAMNEIAL